MKIKLLDIDAFIKDNNLSPVTNPVFFQTGSIPTEDGLFSKSIFGEVGSVERKKRFAYIDLNSKFLHPVIYRLLITMDRKFPQIINGSRFVSLDRSGNIIDDENGETGLDFLYNNFDKINFKTTDSDMRGTKIRLLKNLGRDRVFIDKFLVLPAFLRDYNPSAKDGNKIKDVDVINDWYSKIIRYSSSLSMGSGFSFIIDNTKSQIQNLLLEIFSKLTTDLSGKEGLFRKSLMGKSVDYATRSVITAPNMYSKNYKELEVPFGYTGIPISQLCVLFYPFYSKYISDFIEYHIESFTKVKTPSGIIEIDEHFVKEQFSDQLIQKMVDNYIRNVEGRFDSLKVKDESGKEYPITLYGKELGRNFTVTDLLFIASEDICKNKHVYVSRYPIENFQNIYPSKIAVLSTNKTIDVSLGDKVLKHYPLVFPDYPTDESTFVDSTRINNSYTSSLGADYDGDTVSIRAVFTQEANAEADRLIKSKTMVLNQSGQNTRKIGNDGALAIYCLTK